jgi:hypothetical protein
MMMVVKTKETNWSQNQKIMGMLYFIEKCISQFSPLTATNIARARLWRLLCTAKSFWMKGIIPTHSENSLQELNKK